MEEKPDEITEKQAKKLKKKQEKLQDDLLMSDLQVDADELKTLKKKLSKVAPRAERGVETLFRLVSKNQYTLGTMVDRKSSILISINALILSIVLGTVMSQLGEDPHLIFPIILMLLTNLGSIALAIFATRPELNHGKDAGSKQPKSITNFLFYGNFHDLEESEYTDGLMNLIHQGDELYRIIAHDSYHMGKTLEKKFSFLRKSFNVFLWGIITSVLAFIMCHAMALMGFY